tara:strand:+ start:618 stop:1052 length:435 start_codon:yes stop_codon:yes gene_type:complete
MTNALVTYRPSLLGRSVFDDLFDDFFVDFPRHLKRTTQGYPVADIYTADDGSTVMEFALAGFTKDELQVDVLPEKRSIMVSAQAGTDAEETQFRRIARRGFTKTYVNYDDNLDLASSFANFENGLLTITIPKRPETQPLAIDIS